LSGDEFIPIRSYAEANIVIGCAGSPGNVEANVRGDIASLKASPYLRSGIPIIGYLLDTSTGQLREVKYVDASL
jgi:carbonic anhydrase